MPGYAAPPETVGPAMSVVVALLAPVVDAAAAGVDATPADRSVRPCSPSSCDAAAEGLESRWSPPALLARAVAAWAELVGLVVLELGGHFVGGFEPADALFDAAVRDQADRLGLRD